MGTSAPNPPVEKSEHVVWIESAKGKGLNSLGNDALVSHAEALGKMLGKQLNTTQMRKIFTHVQALGARFAKKFDQSLIPLLKVKLVYAAARERAKLGLLTDVLLPAIDEIRNLGDFRWFARFVEAILAYHRYHMSEASQDKGGK